MTLLSIDFTNLHTVLESLYEEMMPLCGDMLAVSKGLAGLGALFYVAVRVWQSLARAEPIDVYPLLRPFAIGICILLFPTLMLGTLNNALGLIVQGTHSMLETQTMDMEKYREQKDELERRHADGHVHGSGDVQPRKEHPGRIPQPAGTAVRRRLAADRHGKDVLPRGALHSRARGLRLLRVGRVPVHARPMVHPVHIRLPLAARERPVQLHARQDTGADAPE